MSTHTTPPDKTGGTTDRIDLDDRDRRALTERMGVLADAPEVAGEPSTFLVVGCHGDSYVVDATTDECSCPDYDHNLPTAGGRETCKHRARLAFATGERAIPAGVDRDAVDEMLGAHLPGAEPRVAATDGGIILDAGADGDGDGDGGETRPAITEHVEPAAQGGARYLRCAGCTREVIGTDESRLLHRCECPHADR